MLPTGKILDPRVRKSPSSVAFIVILGLGGFAATSTSSSALSPTPGVALASHAKAAAKAANDDIVEVRAVARRGGVAVGPRGNAVARGTVVRAPAARGAVVRPGVAGGVRWARPGWYRWPRGGAIAAGAAVGFVTAATAAAWAGAAPAPGMCWYYTDPSRTQGFWDYCP